MLVYVLEKVNEYNNSWDNSFLIVALIAILIGAVLTFRKTFKSEKRIKKERELTLHDEKILDDPESILKKK